MKRLQHLLRLFTLTSHQEALCRVRANFFVMNKIDRSTKLRQLLTKDVR